MLGWMGSQLEIFVNSLILSRKEVLRLVVLRPLRPVVWTRSLECPSGS